MIGMFMSEQDAIELCDIDVEKLFAEIGRSIDQYSCAALWSDPLDQQRAAAATVFRIIRITIPPALAYARHSRRRAAAKNSENHGHD
jgi:hypothetical protein